MKVFCIVLLFLGLFKANEVESAKVLIFHAVASYSHRVQTWPIAEALAKLGHQVTYISPFYPKEPNPNITELVPKKMADYVDKFLNSEFDINLRVNHQMAKLHNNLFEFGYDSCDALLQSEEFQEWLQKNHKFDLFIIDNCLSECGLGLAKRMGAKTIIFNTVVSFAHEYDSIGFHMESSSIPVLDTTPPPTPMGFFDRLSNTFMAFIWSFKHYFYCNEITTLLRKGLHYPDLPFVRDLLANVSLIFHTGDVVTDHPRSFPPLVVNVAGIHCRDSMKALSKDLEMFINSTNHGQQNDGFVYISLGSLAVSSNLPSNIKKVFFDVIKAFPNLKFLWKWNGDFPTDIPENLYLSKWFPQIDVMGHPKIRAFVMQGGRPSTLEALYNGVPMITFPILGDQDVNANRMDEIDGTIKLEIGTVTYDKFRDAVEKAVYDPTIKARITKLQNIFLDRPMTPVETAIWWVEYVLRHEDTSHLRSSSYSQPWFVRRQVDVWAFLSIGIFLVITSIVLVSFKLINILTAKKPVLQKLKST